MDSSAYLRADATGAFNRCLQLRYLHFELEGTTVAVTSILDELRRFRHGHGNLLVALILISGSFIPVGVDLPGAL